MRIRLLLAAALAVPAFALPAAHAGEVNDWCWENVPSFRLSALVCTKVPSDL